ncbi:MAG: class I SAM-dependent methyltransferase [Alphaproteobacteria bacterium]|nr:class I SAM-dependent methyltransferase [Alphaproteobacteria bacterium]
MLDDLKRRIAAVQRLNAPAKAVYGVSPRPVDRPLKDGPGGMFHCPVCGGRYRRFLPFGLDMRRNARCPGCGSLERHRFLWLQLRDAYRLLRRRVRVLHVAPEPCIRGALAANPGLRYVSVDMFDPAADTAADLTALPFASGEFDVAICSHVLEHVTDDRTAMAELYRVLAPAGRAAVMVPIDMKRAETFEDPSIDTAAGRNEAFGHPYHVRICGADYPGRLRDARFLVDPVHSDMLSPHRRRLWRINRTVLFDCRKPAGSGAKESGPA